MADIRSARIEDINLIQQTEKEYYEGYICPKEILNEWISQLSENFFVAEENGRLVGFIFFEYLNKPHTAPFVHQLRHDNKGRIVYVSEVGVLEDSKEILQELFNEMVNKAKKDGCKKIIWLAGNKHKHDRMETQLLRDNGFSKNQRVDSWEAYPNHFVSDHWLWERTL